MTARGSALAPILARLLRDLQRAYELAESQPNKDGFAAMRRALVEAYPHLRVVPRGRARLAQGLGARGCSLRADR